MAADRLAEGAGWRRITIEGPLFPLAAYLPARGNRSENGVLTVYIEGDGLAWRTKRKPSADPTPVDPVALRLALLDPARPVAYLARPGQYLGDGGKPPCDPAFWLGARFAPQVVDAANMAVSFLKKKTGARSVRLVGYSGGGAIAVLVAAIRDDVKSLVTVAGNLDHKLWTDLHFTAPLSGSLNPADYAQKIALIPQIHFAGAADHNIPRKIADSFVARQGETACSRVVVVPGASHSKGWDTLWGQLLNVSPACKKP